MAKVLILDNATHEKLLSLLYHARGQHPLDSPVRPGLTALANEVAAADDLFKTTGLTMMAVQRELEHLVKLIEPALPTANIPGLATMNRARQILEHIKASRYVVELHSKSNGQHTYVMSDGSLETLPVDEAHKRMRKFSA